MSEPADPKDALVESLQSFIRQVTGNPAPPAGPSPGTVAPLIALAVCVSLVPSMLFSSDELSKKAELFWKIAVGVAGGGVVAATDKFRAWLLRTVSKRPVAVLIYAACAAAILVNLPFRIFPVFPGVSPTENIEVSVDGGPKTTFDASRGVVVNGVHTLQLEASYKGQDTKNTKAASKKVGLFRVFRAALNRAPGVEYLLPPPRIELWPLFAVHIVHSAESHTEMKFQRSFPEIELADDIRDHNSGLGITLDKKTYRLHRSVAAGAGTIFLPAGCYQLTAPQERFFKVEAPPVTNTLLIDKPEKDTKCD